MKSFLVKFQSASIKRYLPVKREIYIPDPALAREAKDPNTSPERLKEISGLESALQEDIAKNPNAPLSLLFSLWAKYPEAMQENPATELLLLEGPHTFCDAPYHFLKAIFALENLPAPFFFIPYRDSYSAALLAAASPSLPAEAALSLLDNNSYTVRMALASNQRLSKSPEVVEKLLQDPTLDVRGSAASLVEASDEICAALSEDIFPAVVRGLAKNPRLPLAYIEKLSTHWDSEVRENIAKNPNTPTHILEKLSRDNIRNIRLAVRENKATLEETRRRLQSEPPIERWIADWPQPILIGDSGEGRLLPYVNPDSDSDF